VQTSSVRALIIHSDIMIIEPYSLLSQNDKIRADANPELLFKIKFQIGYQQLKKFALENDILFDTLQRWLNKANGVPLNLLLKLCKKVNISNDECFKNINYVYVGTKNSRMNFPLKLEINSELFFEGLGLYIGEGVLTEKTNEIALSNTSAQVLQFFLKWLYNCFTIKKKDLNIYIYVPLNNFNKLKVIEKWSNLLNVKEGLIRNVYYHKKSKEEYALIVCNKAVLRYLLNELVRNFLHFTLSNTNLSVAFLRGILAAEGSVYLNPKKNVHHVEIGMKDDEIIGLVGNILNKLGVDYSNKEHDGVFHIIICRKENIQKLIELGGFGSHEKRNILLEKAYDLFKQSQTRRGGALSFYLEKISQNPNVTSRELVKVTNKSLTQIHRILKKLTDKRLVYRKIKTNNTYVYNISEEGIKVIGGDKT